MQNILCPNTHIGNSFPSVLSTGIYYNNSCFFVVSEHTDVTGFTVLGPPFFKMTLDTYDAALGKAVSSCLNASSYNISQEEAQKSNRFFMRLLGEKNGDTLEKHWDYISISKLIENDEIKIVKMQKVQAGGYVSFGKNNQFIAECNEMDTIEGIIKSIIIEPPNTYFEEESHS